jgi:TonB family protein
MKKTIKVKKIAKSWKYKFQKDNSTDFIFKAMSLGVAILLHLALILYLRQAKVFVKIIPFKTETEVSVKKYPSVQLPQKLEEIIKQPPQPEEIRGGGKKHGSALSASAQAATTGAQPGLPGAGTAAGVEKAGNKEMPVIPFDLDTYLNYRPGETNLPPPLHLNLSSRFKTSNKYHFSLKLPVRPETPEASREKNLSPGLKNDTYQYVSPEAYRAARQSLRFSPAGKIIPPTGTGLMTGAQVPSGYHYDIRPWAEKVVSLIQAKWILPQMASMPENKNVALLLRVDRDGQLLTIEINSSTSSDLLDQAAITAVKLSAPFPPLPADFPGKSLEFFLVFTYHE